MIPHDPSIDNTLALWREGYPFLWNRVQRLRSNIFTLRVMGRTAVAVHGKAAAEMFYDETKLQRRGAVPRRVVTSLFGKGAVHTLDDQLHRHRKEAFLSLMTSQSLERLVAITGEEWRSAARSWQLASEVVLFDEAARVLTAAACRWAGVPLSGREELDRRARDFVSMIDAFGGAGPRLWRGKLARMRAERWIEKIVEDVRDGRVRPRGEPLRTMALHRDIRGDLLPSRVAAVELLNVIRPTVAVAWYVTFAALALDAFPHTRDVLLDDPAPGVDTDGDRSVAYADLFVQEVRRFFPFTPYLGAKVRTPFDWHGQRFEKGCPVFLDVYGSNHDPAIWEDPESFRPERFLHFDVGPFDFIPQGGGSFLGHRCPGEWIVMHEVALALHVLTRCVSYRVPFGQDLHFDLSRMPTRPESGLVIADVRTLPAIDGAFPRLPSRDAIRGAKKHSSEIEDAVRHERRSHADEDEKPLRATDLSSPTP